VIAASLPVGGAFAQSTISHELIRLPPICRVSGGPCVVDDFAVARRINDHGGVVGFSHGSGQLRSAFAWFWCDPPATLPPRTTINLSELAGATLEDSDAYDINTHHVVVGWQLILDGNQNDYRRASIWDLAAAQYFMLGTLASGNDLHSEAHGINDGGPTSPAAVVGIANNDEQCFEPHGRPLAYGFAWAINNAGDIAGEAYADCVQEPPCTPDADAVAWQFGSSSPTTLPDLTSTCRHRQTAAQ